MGNNANKTKSMGNKLLILIPDKMLAWKPEYSLNEALMGESHGWWLVWLVVDLWLESAHGYEISHVPSPRFSGISTSHHLGIGILQCLVWLQNLGKSIKLWMTKVPKGEAGRHWNKNHWDGRGAACGDGAVGYRQGGYMDLIIPLCSWAHLAVWGWQRLLSSKAVLQEKRFLRENQTND